MIKINENYGFEADDLNYILMRKTYKRRKEQNFMHKGNKIFKNHINLI